jgi:hypothetical protein
MYGLFDFFIYIYIHIYIHDGIMLKTARTARTARIPAWDYLNKNGGETTMENPYAKTPKKSGGKSVTYLQFKNGDDGYELIHQLRGTMDINLFLADCLRNRDAIFPVLLKARK